jgi:hypothetical protein
MKKLSILFILFAFISLKITAQNTDKKISDLLFLYADEKYDKLVYKSIAVSENDKYRRHPLPQIYAAMGYYEMAKRPGKFSVGERDSEFPKPLKAAQKALYKYMKLEKKAKKYYPDYDGSYDDYTEFYENIADTTNKLAQNLYIMDKARKAGSVYKYGYRAVPDNHVLLLWQALSEIKSKNKVEGDKNLVLALSKIDESYKPTRSTSGVLARGMLLADEYLTQKGDATNAAKARKLVELFKKYDPDELDKKKMAERDAKMKEEAEKDAVMKKFYSDENDEINKDRKKGKIIIEDGEGAKKTEDELDKIEKEAKGDKD